MGVKALLSGAPTPAAVLWLCSRAATGFDVVHLRVGGIWKDAQKGLDSKSSSWDQVKRCKPSRKRARKFMGNICNSGRVHLSS